MLEGTAVGRELVPLTAVPHAIRLRAGIAAEITEITLLLQTMLPQRTLLLLPPRV